MCAGLSWYCTCFAVAANQAAATGAYHHVGNLGADLQGYFLRNTPNPYLTAFAVVSAPNLFGQLLGPILSVTGLYFAGKEQPQQNVSEVSDTEVSIKNSSSNSDRARQ